MKKTLTALFAVAAIAGTFASLATDADAQRRRFWGPAIGLGIVGGIAAGAYLATRPQGYVVYQGYGQPVGCRGGYWSAQPIYNSRGRVIGYEPGTEQMICPYGY